MAQIPDHLIDRIRDSVDIVELISRYLTLRKAGKNYKSHCPFHTEKTPSFTVSPDKQIFYCFGCGAGGNVFNFLMRHEKVSFVEAVQKLAGETGIELPKYSADTQKSSEYDRFYRANQFACDFYYSTLEAQRSKLQDYLSQRAISEETIKFFKIGYVPESWDALTQEIVRKKMPLDVFVKIGLIMESEKDRQKKYDRFRNRLIFPIHNLSGRVVAFGGRTLSRDPDSPKYLNSPESPVYMKSQILYGLYYSKDWIRQEEYVIVVEGYMDFLQLFQNGIKNVVATSGTALTEEHAKIIRRYTQKVILCYDSDEAGIQAAVRGGQILFQQNLETRVLILPDEEDPDSFIKKRGKSDFFSLVNTAKEYFEFHLGQLQKSIGDEDVGQKTKIVKEMVDSLAAHVDPVKQNFYANILAQRFNLQEITLIQEIRRKGKIIRSRGTRVSDSATKESPGENSTGVFRGAWGAEKDILIILLNHFEEVKSVIFDLLEEHDFLNEEFKGIFQLLREQANSHKEDLVHWLFANISDQRIIGLLTADMLKDIENPDRYLNDCILKVKVSRFQNEIDRLRQQLRTVKPADSQFQILLKEINTNVSRIQEIRKIFAEK